MDADISVVSVHIAEMVRLAFRIFEFVFKVTQRFGSLDTACREASYTR